MLPPYDSMGRRTVRSKSNGHVVSIVQLALGQDSVQEWLADRFETPDLLPKNTVQAPEILNLPQTNFVQQHAQWPWLHTPMAFEGREDGSRVHHRGRRVRLKFDAEPRKPLR